MAIGWLTVLKMVPWGDVISNAPKIADGARKLWSTVAKKSPATEPPNASAQPAAVTATPSIANLQAQLAATEAAVSELQQQMLESSELIKGLADQNTQLIQRLDVNRIRVLWLAGAMAVVAIVAAIMLSMTLAR